MERQTAESKKGKKAEDSLYNALPKSLGGTNDQPSSADINLLLPHQKGRRTPSSGTVNEEIRHKVFSLEKGTQTQQKQKQQGKNNNDPTKRNKNNKQNEIASVRQNPKRKLKKNKEKSNKIVLSKAEQKYSIYEPLLNLWLDYATKLRKDDRSNFASRVTKMDLHGAPISVLRSRDPSQVGVQGILIAETANTILVATKKDVVVTLPKNVTVIQIKLGDINIEVLLPALAFRASERSARKFKKKHMPYI